MLLTEQNFWQFLDNVVWLPIEGMENLVIGTEMSNIFVNIFGFILVADLFFFCLLVIQIKYFKKLAWPIIT